MNTFVTEPEIKELTGYLYHSKQAEWLRNNGIRHVISRTGKPKVLRTELDRILFGGVESTTYEPDFSGING